MHARTPSDMHTAEPLSRRDFLTTSFRVSAAGSVLLGLAGGTALLTGCSREAATAAGFKVLRAQDLPLVTRLLSAALADALPAEPTAHAGATQQAVSSFDQLLYDTSPAVRGLFLQLLDLLNLGIARGPLFGLWKTWENASEADAAAVLERLAGSSVGFLRGAYNGLATMAMMAWYLEPAHQSITGYPGPPKKIVG